MPTKKTEANGERELACIVQAIARVRDECEHVEKDAYNDFHKYAYASEASISRAVRKLLAKHKLVIIQSVAVDPPPFIDDAGVTQMVLEFTLAHESGVVWPEPVRVVTQGNDRDSKGSHGDKGAFKANTGGYKYLLSRLFMIDTGDDPERPGSPPTKGRKPKARTQTPADSQPKSESFKDTVWKQAWRRAGQLGSSMSDEVHRDLAVELISGAKRIVGVEKAEDANDKQRIELLMAIERAVLDEDGGAVWEDE